MKKKYVCPCGLVCCDCLFYKPEIYDTAKKLKKTIKDSQWDFFISGNVKNESWNVIAKHLNEEGTEIAKYFESFKKLSEFFTRLMELFNCNAKKHAVKLGDVR